MVWRTACVTNVKYEYNVLNDLRPPKPCENHTKKQCQDKLTAKIRYYQKKVKVYESIWNEVKSGNYQDKNVINMIKFLHFSKKIQELKWKREDCQDSKCDKPDTGIINKPKKKVVCLKGYKKVHGKCVLMSKCVPMSKKTCIAKKAQEIRDNQDSIQKLMVKIEKLKKDKQLADKLKKAKIELSKLRLKSKLLVSKQKHCIDVKCPDNKPKPKPKPKACKSQTRKECRAKYQKLVELTKAKIANHQENKKQQETDKVPNKQAAEHEGKKVSEHQALLKKYLAAFKNCKDKRCPNDPIKTSTNDLVEAYKTKLVAEYT